MAPLVSVVMPVYNAEAFVEEAVNSILTQTFKDFEFIIIDDSSTDKSFSILSRILDPRIKLVRNETNLRISATLNKGIALAKGKYIARMDADDVSLPTRFEKQVQFLEKYPDIALVGTSFILTNEKGEKLYKHPTTSDTELLRWRMFFGNEIGHPTVMFRKSVVTENNFAYGSIPEEFRKYWQGEIEVKELVEDYLLFGLILLKYSVANLPDVLLRYRVHKDSTSVVRNEETQKKKVLVSTFLQQIYLRGENKDLYEEFIKNTKPTAKLTLDRWIQNKEFAKVFFSLGFLWGDYYQKVKVAKTIAPFIKRRKYGTS